MNPTYNHLPLEIREYLTILLNQGLVNVIDLTQQVHMCHWNTRGIAGNSVHKLFDEVYEYLLEVIDTTAERIKQLGGNPMGTAQDVESFSQLPKFDITILDQTSLIILILDRLILFINSLDISIEITGMKKDWATQNILIDTTQALQKFVFLLENNLA